MTSRCRVTAGKWLMTIMERAAIGPVHRHLRDSRMCISQSERRPNVIERFAIKKRKKKKREEKKRRTGDRELHPSIIHEVHEGSITDREAKREPISD